MEDINRDAIGGLVSRCGCAALIIAIIALIISILV